VSNNLLILINRLSTAVLLVVMLFACQNMPETDRVEGFEFEDRAN